MISSRPVVTASAECFGLRPVANAFGAGSSTTYRRGLGSPAAMQRPSTRLWYRRYSVWAAALRRPPACRVACRRAPLSAGSELDLGGLGVFGSSVEEVALPEVEHVRQEHRGELLDLRVVAQHAVVVVLPRVRHAVLGARQLLLEVQEVLVR